MAVVNEIITEFGYQGSVSPLTEYNNALGKSIGLLAATATAILATAGAVATFVTNTTQAIDPLIQLSRATGESVETIQELGFAASVSGSSAEALQQTVSMLSERIGEAAQKGSEEFSRLGISVRDANGDVKSTSDILLEVGQRFQELDLSLAEQRSFAASLGIDPSLVQLLNRTSGEMSELRQRARELGTVNEEQAEAAVRLNDAMTTLRFGLDGVKNQIAVGLAPEIERIIGKFVDFLQANRDVISDGVTGVVEVLTALAETTVRVLPLIGVLTAGFVAWKVASIGLATVLGTIFSPVVLITAGIAALVLIVDDLIVAAQGGQSVIADFFSEFFGIDIGPPLRAAYDAFIGFTSNVIDAAKNVAMIFTDVFRAAFAVLRGDFDAAGEYASTFITNVVSVFRRGMAQLIDEISRLTGVDFGQVGQVIASAIIDPIRETFSSLFSWLKERFSDVSDLVGGVASFFGLGGEQANSERAEDERQSQPATRRDLSGQQRQALGFEGVEDEELDRVVRIRDVMQLERQSIEGPQAEDQNVNRAVTVRDVVTLEANNVEVPQVEDQNVNRAVTVRDLVELQGSDVEQLQAEDQDLNRAVTVRDVVTLEAGTVEVPQVGDQNVNRAVTVRDLVELQGSDVEQPNINPVSALRSIGVVNNFTQTGQVPLPQMDPQTLTRQVQVNNQFSGVNEALTEALSREQLDVNMLSPSLTPQTAVSNTTNNSQQRNVTIEQSNNFSITGDQGSTIADTVANRLQDQLDDAEQQIRVGGF